MPGSFDSAGPFGVLATIAAAAAGVDNVYEGPPKSLAYQVTVVLMLGGATFAVLGQHVRRFQDYELHVGYFVDADVVAAEAGTGAVTDAIEMAVLNNQALRDSHGTATALAVQLLRPKTEPFWLVSGMEFRDVLVLVRVEQHYLFPLPQ